MPAALSRLDVWSTPQNLKNNSIFNYLIGLPTLPKINATATPL
jgi:hypothetical protein